MQKTILLSFLLIATSLLKAQILEPVKWSFSSNRLSATEKELIFTATIEDTWSLYGMDIPPGGPIPTEFEFEADDSKFTLVGKVREPKGEVKFDPNFDMNVKLFEKEAVFTQKVRLHTTEAFSIKGFVVFMCCDETRCLPPTDIPFEFKISEYRTTTEDILKTEKLPDETSLEDTLEFEEDIVSVDIDDASLMEEVPITETGDKDSSLRWVFIMGFLGGLLALLTPCVFPLIPMTVSFFLRSTKSRKKAISDALVYGFSIVVIYVLLGFSISIIFGPNALNAMATSPFFNIFFFLLLIVFAISFFGVFELQMPSKWTNALDSKADKTSGLISIFLMAFTLVLVSFSCTGPIIGTLLVEAAVTGNNLAPIMGMTGFSIALAIPFTLFAIFPSWLKSMPKSGGWLNSVKVVLAFILLALSLKFLSTADLVAQWNLLSRPVYLALWIAIFSMLGLYLLGKIKFSHDSELTHLPVSRLFLVIIVFSFVIYMIPGMFGAPLKSISSFLPPMTTQNFVLGTPGVAVVATEEIPEDKNVTIGAHGLVKFLDYEEGLSYAKENNKPVFLDFTGFGCANCKRMEAAVWSDPRVLSMLRDDYIIISLYVDDRTTLAEKEQYVSDLGGRERRIKTIGNKWSDFQARHYGVNSQPYYVLLDYNGEMLIPETFAYNTDADAFTDFLNNGLESFRQGSMHAQKE